MKRFKTHHWLSHSLDEATALSVFQRNIHRLSPAEITSWRCVSPHHGTLAKISGAEIFVGDKGYDSQSVPDKVVEQGEKPVIPRRKNAKVGNGDID